MISVFVDRLGQWNPQFFREIKGRLKPRNIAIASGISLVAQGFLYFFYQNLLPLPISHYSKSDFPIVSAYCTGDYNNGYGYGCVKDALGNWIVNWQMWWLEIFLCLSIIGIFALLVAGTWMLVADLSREESRGTLNFIRQTPQSAKNILLGKMLGIPILLYLAVAIALPLHIVAGLSAHVPLGLLLAFYGIVVASCAFFYTMALLFALVATGLVGFQAWLASGLVLLFLSGMPTMIHGNASTRSPFDWLTVLYPATALNYLVQNPPLSSEPLINFDYLQNNLNLGEWHWYGQPLWQNAWTGIGFILLHYIWWTYWGGQALKRSFHNPLATLSTKKQSYLLSTGFILILLGFIQPNSDADSFHLFNNFGMLQLFIPLFFCIFIISLSPQRQTLYDWARYRHQMSSPRQNLLKELIWGEKSPAPIALAINLAIMLAFILPAIVLAPLDKYKIPLLWGFLLEANVILIYGTLAQLMLLMKTPKRAIAAISVIGALIILPVASAIAFISLDKVSFIFLFSAIPAAVTEYATLTQIIASILCQWAIIAFLSFQIVQKLRKAGASATKALS
jgi:hypothetical protein